MTLRELKAQFLKLDADLKGMRTDATLAEADGVQFACPKCWQTNGGLVGTHYVCCWFTGKVADNVDPGPGRWNPSGTGLDDLTFVPPGSTSVLINGGCNAHFFVERGSIRMC